MTVNDVAAVHVLCKAFGAVTRVDDCAPPAIRAWREPHRRTDQADLGAPVVVAEQGPTNEGTKARVNAAACSKAVRARTRGIPT